jgi:hypothetical protein
MKHGRQRLVLDPRLSPGKEKGRKANPGTFQVNASDAKYAARPPDLDPRPGPGNEAGVWPFRLENVHDRAKTCLDAGPSHTLSQIFDTVRLSIGKTRRERMPFPVGQGNIFGKEREKEKRRHVRA